LAAANHRAADSNQLRIPSLTPEALRFEKYLKSGAPLPGSAKRTDALKQHLAEHRREAKR
jgi:hypothetical protein